jgi:hypothetical protein
MSISLRLKLDTGIINFNINIENKILKLEEIYEKFRLMGITDEYFGNICIIINKQNFKKRIQINIDEINDTFIFICGEIDKTNHINYLIKKYYSYLDSSININTKKSNLLYDLPKIDNEYVQSDNNYESDTNTDFSFPDEESEHTLDEEIDHTLDEENKQPHDEEETDNLSYNFLHKEDYENKKLITQETIDKINSETIKLFEDEDFKYLIQTYMEYPNHLLAIILLI